MKPVSVSQINTYIKHILTSDPILMNVSVIGELSNLTKHSSGHWYFSLKDEKSTIRCFLPFDKVQQLRFDIEDGMSIIAYGSVSLYEKSGSYSLIIKDIDVEGEGNLKKAFNLLFEKLEKKGFFNENTKKTLPSFPKKIGIITSPTGAAVKDIITTTLRRNPLVNLLIYPSMVQGENAAQSIINGIQYFNNKRDDIDLIILGRGGGSTEDLWTFNEESLATAIYNSELPVISAVGHEVDYVISDYVADVRAATPTAAAEIAVPDITYYKDILHSCKPTNMFCLIEDNIFSMQEHIKTVHEISSSLIKMHLVNCEHKLEILKSTIDNYNPYNQLEKGYAIIKDSNDNWIYNQSNTNINDKIKVLLKDGELECLVLKKLLKN